MARPGPIDKEVAETMTDIGRTIAGALPEGWGFCLLTFQFGAGTDGTGGNTNYMSNANREDMIATLEEFLKNVKEGTVHERARRGH